MYCQVYVYRTLHTNFTTFTVKKGYSNYKINTECLQVLDCRTPSPCISTPQYRIVIGIVINAVRSKYLQVNWPVHFLDFLQYYVFSMTLPPHKYVSLDRISRPYVQKTKYQVPEPKPFKKVLKRLVGPKSGLAMIAILVRVLLALQHISC